jgi:hypothetical protein
MFAITSSSNPFEESTSDPNVIHDASTVATRIPLKYPKSAP